MAMLNYQRVSAICVCSIWKLWREQDRERERERERVVFHFYVSGEVNHAKTACFEQDCVEINLLQTPFGSIHGAVKQEIRLHIGWHGSENHLKTY